MTQSPAPYYPPPAPLAPRPPFNGLGVAGFVVSLVGFFFGCLLCPVGLLLSLVALFKRPRGFAIAGVILGLIGSIIPAFFLLLFGVAAFSIGAAILKGGMPVINTVVAVEEGHKKIDNYISNHGYLLPDDDQGNAALAGLKDAWGRPLHYQRQGGTRYEIRSAGSDGLLDTTDDLPQTFPAPAAPKPE